MRRATKRLDMKATHIIGNKKATIINISFAVTHELIEYIIAMMIDSGTKTTKANIMFEIRSLLNSDGGIHFQYRSDEFSKEIQRKAKKTALKLYPDFY